VSSTKKGLEKRGFKQVPCNFSTFDLEVIFMIVVTTPTGLIGHQVLNSLLASSEPIRVIVRDPSRLPTHIRERVEVVQGSHGDLDVVNQAFAGAHSVFWLVPPDPRAQSVYAAYVDFSRPATKAIVRHGVERVVSISALGRGVPLNAGNVSASLAMDDLITSTGVPFRALTMPSFMDNILQQVGSIKRQRVFFGPIPADLKLPTCATRDITAAAARLLLDHTWSGQGHVAVLGPEDLSFNDMAHIMSEVLERPIHFQHISGEAFKAMLIEQGMSDAMAQGLFDMMMAKNEGIDKAEPRTPESTSPTSFRQWCEEVLKPAVLA
jgi:uncharacterized protein YbjT (DUF2867 family)